MPDLSETLDQVAAEGSDEAFDIDIDFSGTDDNVPAGEYEVRVKSAALGKSKAGNPQVVVVTVIQDGDFAGRQLRLYLGLTKKVLWKTRKHLNNLGIEVSSEGSFRLSPDLFDDLEFTATVSTEGSEFGSIEDVSISGTGFPS